MIINMRILFPCNVWRHFSTVSNPKVRVKRSKKEIAAESKASPDVVQYLKEIPNYAQFKDDIPKYLLKKYRTPQNVYLSNKNTAKYIVDLIGKHLSNGAPIVEVNPGMCILTEELLARHRGDVYLYESSTQFEHFKKELITKHGDRVHYKLADFFNMWKLAFQDKMDQGTRVQDLLSELATQNSDKQIKIIGAMPSMPFIQHLVYTIIFHNSYNVLMRPDLLIVLPLSNFEHLTSTKKCKQNQSLPSLFQILFDYKILGSVPRNDYLPWQLSASDKKVKSLEDDHMYIVNITQKERLPCKSEHLPLLWYFLRPHMASKNIKVIPSLEQWIPGCGVWLITGQDPPDTNKDLAPTEDDAKLPHMTIFTQFGDLDLRQKLTVFKRFISWPEFEQSPFRVTMESNLPKSLASSDGDDKDHVGTHLDEGDAMSDAEDDHKPLEAH